MPFSNIATPDSLPWNVVSVPGFWLPRRVCSPGGWQKYMQFAMLPPHCLYGHALMDVTCDVQMPFFWTSHMRRSGACTLRVRVRWCQTLMRCCGYRRTGAHYCTGIQIERLYCPGSLLSLGHTSVLVCQGRFIVWTFSTPTF